MPAGPLLNHLIRPLQEGLGDREPEGLRGLEGDDQLKRRSTAAPPEALLDLRTIHVHRILDHNRVTRASMRGYYGNRVVSNGPNAAVRFDWKSGVVSSGAEGKHICSQSGIARDKGQNVVSTGRTGDQANHS